MVCFTRHEFIIDPSKKENADLKSWVARFTYFYGGNFQYETIVHQRNMKRFDDEADDWKCVGSSLSNVRLNEADALIDALYAGHKADAGRHRLVLDTGRCWDGMEQIATLPVIPFDKTPAHESKFQQTKELEVASKVWRKIAETYESGREIHVAGKFDSLLSEEQLKNVFWGLVAQKDLEITRAFFDPEHMSFLIGCGRRLIALMPSMIGMCPDMPFDLDDGFIPNSFGMQLIQDTKYFEEWKARGLLPEPVLPWLL